jgi:hypothetical protein
VTKVRVDYDAGIATIEGSLHDAAAYERAVTGAVAGKPLRRVMEHLSGYLTPRPPLRRRRGGGRGS